MISSNLFYDFFRSQNEDDLKNVIIKDLNKSNLCLIENDLGFLYDFLKDHVEYTKCIDNTDEEEAMNYIKKLLNCFKIEEDNIHEIIKTILENTKFYYCRISDWNTMKIPIINDINKTLYLKCYYAEFKCKNNWEHERYSLTCKIICYENKVIWIHSQRGEAPEYFVIKNNKIYGLSTPKMYDRCYKKIFIYKDLDITYKDIIFDIDKLDKIVNVNFVKKSEFNEIVIDLEKYFYKGFFYKGILWDRNWEGHIALVSNIYFSDTYLIIEITNLTYPHSGYLLVNLEEGKVIEAKKHEQ